MISLDAHTKVYLAAGATDLRKQIDGLAALVVDVLHEDPFSSHVFCFCNRGRDKLKILFDHTNGFWLWYRRLERQRFWWPPAGTPGPVALSLRELHWLLDGLDPQRVAARALGIEHMAAHGVQGRGVLVDLFSHCGEHPRREVGYDDLMRILDTDQVVIEPGDICTSIVCSSSACTWASCGTWPTWRGGCARMGAHASC